MTGKPLSCWFGRKEEFVGQGVSGMENERHGGGKMEMGRWVAIVGRWSVGVFDGCDVCLVMNWAFCLPLVCFDVVVFCPQL